MRDWSWVSDDEYAYVYANCKYRSVRYSRYYFGNVIIFFFIIFYYIKGSYDYLQPAVNLECGHFFTLNTSILLATVTNLVSNASRLQIVLLDIKRVIHEYANISGYLKTGHNFPNSCLII